MPILKPPQDHLERDQGVMPTTARQRYTVCRGTHLEGKLATFGTESLAPREAVLVRVASFTFRFTTTKQLRDCIEYYKRKPHPSSRVSAKAIAPDIGPDWRELRSWEVER